MITVPYFCGSIFFQAVPGATMLVHVRYWAIQDGSAQKSLIEEATRSILQYPCEFVAVLHYTAAPNLGTTALNGNLGITINFSK